MPDCPNIGESAKIFRWRLNQGISTRSVFQGKVTKCVKIEGEPVFWLQVEKIDGEPIPVGTYKDPIVVSCWEIVSDYERTLLKIEVSNLLKRTDRYQG